MTSKTSSSSGEHLAHGCRRERASKAQSRLWFEHFTANHVVYHVPAAFVLRGALDVVALRRAFRALAARHEALRTTFDKHAGEPVQVIWPAAEDAAAPDFLIVEPAPDDGALVLRDRLQTLASEPFDLRAGPLWWARLFTVSPDEAVLAITMHHIITDGWSFGLLGAELAAYYGAFTGQSAPAALGGTLQYADFAKAEHREMGGPRRDALRRHWRDELAGVPPALTLPADRPLAAKRTSAGGHVWVDVPDAQADSLRAYARAHGVTLYALLLACFGVLLYRYSREQTIVIGTPVANRRRAEFETIVGLFANAVPLRLQFDTELTLRELLTHVRATTSRALAHQALSFDEILDAAGIERNPQRSPLFQVMFTLQAPAVLRLPGLRSEPFDIGHPVSAYELSLVVFDAQPLRAVWEYSTELFDRPTVERIAAHYLRLADALIAEPDVPLGAVSWQAPNERRLVSRRWESRWTASPDVVPVHQRFEAQVRSTPTAVAIVHDGRSVTYAQLNEQANRLARSLRQCGVDRETRVAVWQERGVEAVVSMLGVLKSGGTYVPLDVHDPPERLRRIVAASNATQLVTDASPRDLAWLPVDLQRVIPISPPEEQAADDLGVPVDPDQLAYTCFTSGSTGTSKGVMIPHRSIATRIEWEQQALPVHRSDAILSVASLCFDASIWEMLRALTSGARLVIPAASPSIDAAALVETMAVNGVSIACFVPSVLAALVEEPAFRDCAALRCVICSGEPLPAELISQFSMLSAATLFNFYGQTEVTIDAAYSSSEQGMAMAAIHQPVGGAVLRILDGDLEPVPLGVAGEIFVGGPGLARGYIGQPDLTAACFVPDPAASVPGARLHRTGDIGSLHADGALEILGRRDDQVKWNGIRLELTDLEAILRTHPDVADAVVVLHEGSRLAPSSPAAMPHDDAVAALARGAAELSANE